MVDLRYEALSDRYARTTVKCRNLTGFPLVKGILRCRKEGDCFYILHEREKLFGPTDYIAFAKVDSDNTLTFTASTACIFQASTQYLPAMRAIFPTYTVSVLEFMRLRVPTGLPGRKYQEYRKGAMYKVASERTLIATNAMPPVLSTANKEAHTAWRRLVTHFKKVAKSQILFGCFGGAIPVYPLQEYSAERRVDILYSSILAGAMQEDLLGLIYSSAHYTGRRYPEALDHLLRHYSYALRIKYGVFGGHP